MARIHLAYKYKNRAILLFIAFFCYTCQTSSDAPSMVTFSPSPLVVQTEKLSHPTGAILPNPDITATNTTQVLIPLISPSETELVLLHSPIISNPELCIPGKWSKEFGIVEWVSDGDTIVVNIRGLLRSVHYIGIDAPEEISITERQGPTASRRNLKLVKGSVVELYRDEQNVDEHGQLLRYVFAGNYFINYQLVLEGLALVDAKFPNLSCIETFGLAEQSARYTNVGIWESIAFSPVLLSSPTISQIRETGTPVYAASFTPSPPYPITPSAPTNLLRITPSLTATRESQPTPTNLKITVHPTSPTPNTKDTPTSLPTITSTPDQFSIQITDIHFAGDPLKNESDEYLEFKNFGSQEFDLTDWVAFADESGASYIFIDFVISPGQTCRIYTNEDHPEFCSLNFESDFPIWNNDEDDCGYLLDTNWIEISQYCYTIP